MDPQAAWIQLQEAYRNRDWEAVGELAQSLLDWLERGGFPPITPDAQPDDVVRQRTIVTRFCRSALQQLVKPQPPLSDGV